MRVSRPSAASSTGGSAAVRPTANSGVYAHRTLGVPDLMCSRYFRDQPLLHPRASDDYLLAWHFEDWLKKYFFAILQILEVCHLASLRVPSHSSFYS